MSIFRPIADLPICEIIEGGPVDTLTAFARNIVSQRAGRILLEVNVAKNTAGYVGTITPMPIADFPICDFPELVGTDGIERLLFSDGEWDGKPLDSYFPNKLAVPRIGSSSDVERQIPVSPDDSRRGDTALGSYELQNADGALDNLPDQYSPGDQSVRLRYVFEDDDSGNGRILAEGIGDQWEVTYDVIRLLVKSSSSYLDQPLWLRQYTGKGGLTGDVSLAGTIVPTLFGECFNVTPIKINNDYWVYQVHDGPILAVDAVKERGLPFTYAGDFPDYAHLVAYAFEDIGQYATCTALGLFRCSFPTVGPAGAITADIRGYKSTSGYTDRTGEILSQIAIERGALTTSLIDILSFGQLPTGPVGYYSDQNDLKISNIFDALLGGINGWYGSDRYRLLRAGYIDEPQTKAASHTITQEETIDIEQVSLSSPARWRQTLNYGKNWTPMADGDVSVLLDSDVRNRLIAEFIPLVAESGATKVRQKSAIVGTDMTSYFRDVEDAQIVLDRVMSLYKEDRRLLRITMWRTGYQINMQDYVMLISDRLGQSFKNGRMMVVVGLKDSGSPDTVVITVYG